METVKNNHYYFKYQKGNKFIKTKKNELNVNGILFCTTFGSLKCTTFSLN
ncbi:MAG TPA: hypothetical protein PK816_12070 [Candidatus Cloacimonadota bacterium]|nr:hypothetical protein [Candidatus Cloacimonadota bacterium]